jgi:hypothetical protein
MFGHCAHLCLLRGGPQHGVGGWGIRGH